MRKYIGAESLALLPMSHLDRVQEPKKENARRSPWIIIVGNSLVLFVQLEVRRSDENDVELRMSTLDLQ